MRKIERKKWERKQQKVKEGAKRKRKEGKSEEKMASYFFGVCSVRSI